MEKIPTLLPDAPASPRPAAANLLFVAAAALIGGDGRVLVQQRPPGRAMAGLWEFPGGKVEPGEAPDAALIRELHEELGIMAPPPTPLAFAAEPLGGRTLILLLYVLHQWEGAIAAHDGQALQWVDISGLRALAAAGEMPPADGPLVERLAEYLAAQRLGDAGGISGQF